jgi:putative ABC transport system permease protein
VTGSVIGAGRHADTTTEIIGTTDQAATTLGLRMRSGQFVTTGLTRQTAVLGQDVALQLFGSDVAIGRTLTLRGQMFTVIGIINRFESSATVSNLFDLNKAVFVPLDAAKEFNQGIAQIQQVNARVATSNLKPIVHNLQTTLLASHGGEEDFSVLRPGEALAVTSFIFDILTGLTAAVASVSIIVGGVGIMNIMLVSVTERTREIGIRKAVGATNKQILSQFLIEALVMSLTGGVIGIIFGYGLAFAAGTFLAFMPGFSWHIIAIALGIAVAVGILFGAWPAIKAARKDPIEALRYFQ